MPRELNCMQTNRVHSLSFPISTHISTDRNFSTIKVKQALLQMQTSPSLGNFRPLQIRPVIQEMAHGENGFTSDNMNLVMGPKARKSKVSYSYVGKIMCSLTKSSCNSSQLTGSLYATCRSKCNINYKAIMSSRSHPF